MIAADKKIKICRSTRTIFQLSLLWPPDNEELNPGKKFYSRLLVYTVLFSVWFFGIFMHLIATFTSDADLVIIEDVAFFLVSCGIGYVSFIYAINQKKLVLLLEDLSNFDDFGTPPNFDINNKRLNLASWMCNFYVALGSIAYAGTKYLDKEECEKVDSRGLFNQICGSTSPLWVPVDLKPYPYFYCLCLVYSGICSQFFVKLSLMMSFHAVELCYHIGFRIDHLNIIITECFDGGDLNLAKCIAYHQKILTLVELVNLITILRIWEIKSDKVLHSNAYPLLIYQTLSLRKVAQIEFYHHIKYLFGSRLDDCFSTLMFAHITMTSAIIASIEKQFMDNFRDVGAAFHAVGWIMSLFMASFGGQKLQDFSDTIPKTIWECKWHDSAFTKDLRFMLMRSQKNMKLTAGPFGVLSYSLFLGVMKMSYSIMCMLTS